MFKILYTPDWKKDLLGDISTIQIGGTPARNEPRFWASNGNGHLWVAISDLGPKWITTTTEYITDEGVKHSNVKPVPKGTLLMSFKLTIGRVGFAGMNLYTNEAIAAFFPKGEKVWLPWLYYALPSVIENNIAAEQAIKGQTLNKKKLQNFVFYCPEYDEQRRIANILDTLDTQIQQTEQLIAKLKQIKLGLLHDLLTRGIDENGNVRDPVAHPEEFKEVFFLQKRIKIPKKWEIQPLHSLLTGIDAGKSPNCPDQPAGAGDWGVLKVSAVHPSGFRAEENKVIINPAYINPVYEVQDGDLLMSRANTYELVGIVCLVSKPRAQLLLCDKTLRLQVNKKNALSKFIFYMLQMPFVRSQIEMHATGSSGSMKNINQNSIKNLAIYAPLRKEQEETITILEAHDARIATEESDLAKLKQLKKGLMHDLLTGRVRVTQLIVEREHLSI